MKPKEVINHVENYLNQLSFNWPWAPHKEETRCIKILLDHYKQTKGQILKEHPKKEKHRIMPPYPFDKKKDHK